MRDLGESYQIYYEDTDLVVKRLLHGKLESFESVGILPIAKSLHSEKGAFEDDLLNTSRWFYWDNCPAQGSAGWRFPGQGMAYPTCGSFAISGCLEHSPGFFKKIKMNCGRAQCPVCHKTWLVRSTKNIVKRIEAGRPKQRRKAIHVSISPPPEDRHLFLDKKGYLKQRRKAIKLLKQAGIIGGCLIYHPYRENDLDQWYFSPHFHTICYGWVQGRGFYARTGWVVKNHRVRKSIGATAYYQLSHAGVKASHHVVTWYGTLSWRHLKRLPADPTERETCPICGGYLRRVIWQGLGDNPLSDPEVLELRLPTLNWRYGS